MDRRGLSDTPVPPVVARIQLFQMGEIGVVWVSTGNGGTSPPSVTPCFSRVPPIPTPSLGDSPSARAGLPRPRTALPVPSS
jgi:hypothetical protein